MKSYVLSLSDTQSTLEIVGGKGLSLTNMINAGFPVPDGFSITTDAYRAFIEENRLQEKILACIKKADISKPDTLESASQEINRLFQDARIPMDIGSSISNAYTGSIRKGTPVAVRSSATAEDLPDASFAGQQETFLNIQGEEALLEAVKKCWASLWTARAIAYRIKNEIDQDTVALAVVVQELIAAEAAGIMFTVNPVNGNRNELVINAAWGLGEAVVSGAVSPDTYMVNREKGRVIKLEVEDKTIMTIRTEKGTAEVPVADALRKKVVLKDRQIMELAQLGMKIEEFYGSPMDVEWAVVENRFFIVQARPITALPPQWILPDPTVMYGRGSLAEHLPGPVTPLFATLGLRLANDATTEMWDRILGTEARNMMSDQGFYLPLNGYVYGGFRMKGNELRIMRMSFGQIKPMFTRSVERWLEAREKFAAVVQSYENLNIANMSPEELLKGIETLLLASCRYFTDIQSTLPAASMSEIIFTRFYNSLIKRKGDPEATVFLFGSETAVLRSEKSLFDLAQWIKQIKPLAEYVSNTPAQNLSADLMDGNQPAGIDERLWMEWRQRVSTHLHTHGRTAYEFDFANPTPMENPAPQLETVKFFLEGKAENPSTRQREAVGNRHQAVERILQRVRWPFKGWFEKLLRWAQNTGPMREDSIFDMGMGHPLMRRMLAELGRRSAENGAIESADDIYWLEESEVLELVSGLEKNGRLADHSKEVINRKADWKSKQKINPPVMLPEKTAWNFLIHGAEAKKQNGKLVLKGIGTSSGIVTATARVLLSPADFDSMQPGDVLVSVTTTPAWTPLFTLASAVVTDIGGPLSHSSIVAREYGIPAVMAARVATRHIRNGQMVTVDGSAGTVTLD